ncbi:hypothetical protein [Actinomadura litoris]|uniref:hypothetical protein n=1 Tax=Actinomadura litoris TaxID=2678616 RepID=UPI001FA77DDB|nr:hypothetical protein [Actinomadura litoris]
MSVLHLAITSGTPELQRRAVDALETAGIEVYRAWIEPNDIELAEAKRRGVPDRKHLIGRQVRLRLNDWARPGPTEGEFAGQGEQGLSLIVEGGGRYTYQHHEVAGVTPS